MKPEWLKIRSSAVKERDEVMNLLSGLSLNTVCKEAACPNMGECYSRKTATFMILGTNCSRGCRFCNVTDGHPSPVDDHEPTRVAEAVKQLGLKHVVITSVTRDDLVHGGAEQFAKTISALRELTPKTTIEVLIPDFQMDEEALMMVIKAEPDVIAHNIETVESLYSTVRPDAGYQQSLDVLAFIKKHSDTIVTKSSIMLGLGETKEQVIKVLEDLRKQACDFLTLGQYLSPSKAHHPVISYIHPDVFESYKTIGYKMKFKYIASGPLVRSSYHADEAMDVLRH